MGNTGRVAADEGACSEGSTGWEPAVSVLLAWQQAYGMLLGIHGYILANVVLMAADRWGHGHIESW